MAAIRPCTGTTADWKAVEDTLILKEREIGVEIDTSGHYQIRQGDGKKKFFDLPIIVNNARYLKRMYRIRERKERHDKKVSGLFMKRVVFTLILAAFIFTVVMIFVFLRMGSEPSTLIENVFRFLSVEGGAMALIKSVKTVKGTKSNGEIQHNDEPEQDDEEVQG